MSEIPVLPFFVIGMALLAWLFEACLYWYEKRKLKRLTPTNDELIALARRHPPDQEWFDGEIEKPW